MAKNSYLDKIVREQLENYEVEYNPQDWTLLNAMIDEAIVPATDVVDQAAQDVLKQFEVAYKPSDWALMNTKLDAQVPDFDDIAKDNLENLEVPYVASDWALMNAKLDAQVPDFDDIAKGNLENLEVPYVASDWALMNAKLDAQIPDFDDIAKDNLENLEVPYVASDWALMNAKLDAQVPDFDDIAKGNLENLEVPYVASDWALMNDLLDDINIPSIDQAAKDALGEYEPENTSADWALMTTLLASLETPPIDEVAKNALENNEVAYNPTDWAIMSDKLDATNFVDPLDTIAKQALSQQEVPFESKDWALMNEELDKDNKMRNRLLFAKSVELFLMIFAIWTIFLFIPDADLSKKGTPSTTPVEKYQTPQQPKEPIESAEEWDESQPMANNEVQETNTGIRFNKTATTSNSNKETENNSLSDSNTELNDNNYTIAKNTATRVEQIAKSKNKNAIANKQQPTKVERHTLIGGNRYGNNTNQNSIGKLEVDQKRANANAPTDYGVFTESELLEAITLAQSEKNATNLDYLEGKFAYLPEKRDLEMPVEYSKAKLPINRIALLTGGDFYQINTPDDAPLKQAQSGYSFGLRADFEIDEKLEWAMGVMMAEFFYTHRTTEPLSQATNSFTLIGTNNIKVSTLQLPLHIQYNMYDEYPWRAYATGGVTGHFVIQRYQNKGEMTLINLANTSRGTNNPRAQNSDLGIFEEGGTMADNVFATADIGVGVERRINEHWGAFLQPTYRVGLSPTGNDQDHINTISFLLGARLTL